jgi:quercetin dioxygenase-like cupin family protein
LRENAPGTLTSTKACPHYSIPMTTKRLAMILSIGLCAAVPAARAQTNTKPLMGSTAIEWDSIKATTNNYGSVRKFFDAPTATLNNLECHVTTLNPGMASHPPHHHPHEEVVIIREGTVEALIDGEWKRVGPGSVVFNACNITHDMRNVGDTPAVYHVFSWRSSLTPAMASHADTIEDLKVDASQAKDGILGPVAIDWNSVEVKTNDYRLSRKFFESRTATTDVLEFHATTVKPGEPPRPPVQHPEEEVIVVKEGTVEALVNGEWKTVGPGSVIFNAANTLHAIRNAGETPVTYFVLGWHTPAP